MVATIEGFHCNYSRPLLRYIQPYYHHTVSNPCSSRKSKMYDLHCYSPPDSVLRGELYASRAQLCVGVTKKILTLGAHAQRGLRYLVCVCVCVCVCVTQHLTFGVTIHATNHTNHLLPKEGQMFKRFSLEILPSRVMAPRRYFVFPLTVASLIT